MNDDRRTIWTVGHSDRTAEDLVALLSGHGVEHVVDVRSHPWSRRHPWHGRPEMETALSSSGIGYTWLGGSLGGMRPDGYRVHQLTDEYREGLRRLLELSSKNRTAVLCAERDPWHCHRRFIADDLVREGRHVVHVLGEKETSPHQPSLL